MSDLPDLLADGHLVLARGQQGISQKILTEELQRLANEIKEDIADGPTVIVEGIQILAEGLQRLANQTALQAEALETLKGRQAISGAFQAISLTILVLWIMMLAGKALYECCVKKVEQQQEEKHQEMVEMLEASLARRKAKRRATAKQAGDAPQ